MLQVRLPTGLLSLVATLTILTLISLHLNTPTVVGHPRRGILFLSNSYSGHYNTRVQQIYETWGSRTVNSNLTHLIIVTKVDGLRIRTDQDVRGTYCDEAYKGKPECCKRGEMLQMAWDYLQSEAGAEIEWSAFIDDDVYILPDNLYRYIQELGPHAVDEYKMYGVAMGTTQCSGVWGGTGFVVNRKTLDVILHQVSPPFKNVTEEILSVCGYCGNWGDIAQSYIALRKRNGVIKHSNELHSANRAYLYNMSREDLEVSFHQDLQNLPWIFHHSSRDNMYWLESKVEEYRADVPWVDPVAPDRNFDNT